MSNTYFQCDKCVESYIPRAKRMYRMLKAKVALSGSKVKHKKTFTDEKAIITVTVLDGVRDEIFIVRRPPKAGKKIIKREDCDPALLFFWGKSSPLEYDFLEILAFLTFRKTVVSTISPVDGQVYRAIGDVQSLCFKNFTVAASDYVAAPGIIGWCVTAKYLGKSVAFDGSTVFGGFLRKALMPTGDVVTYPMLISIWDNNPEGSETVPNENDLRNKKCYIGVCSQDSMYIFTVEGTKAELLEVIGISKPSGRSIVCGYWRYFAYINDKIALYGFDGIAKSLYEIELDREYPEDQINIIDTLFNPADEMLYVDYEYTKRDKTDIIPVTIVDAIYERWVNGYFFSCYYDINWLETCVCWCCGTACSCVNDAGEPREVAGSVANYEWVVDVYDAVVCLTENCGITATWATTYSMTAGRSDISQWSKRAIYRVKNFNYEQFADIGAGYFEVRRTDNFDVRNGAYVAYSNVPAVDEIDRRIRVEKYGWNILTSGIAYKYKVTRLDSGRVDTVQAGTDFLKFDGWEAVLKFGVDRDDERTKAPGIAYCEERTGTAKVPSIQVAFNPNFANYAGLGNRAFFQRVEHCEEKEIEVDVNS